MPQDKADQPLVATFGEYEVISPPNKLRKALSKVAADDPKDDPVARAEQALATLSNDFSIWMNDECNRLDAARRDVNAKGFTKATRDALFHAAHDIKGEAATFGYPLVAPVADSLCRLIEHTPDVDRLPLRLVDQHVDAALAIFHRNTRGDVGKYAAELAQKLRQVTDEFLLHENRDRPDALESILSPSLVP